MTQPTPQRAASGPSRSASGASPDTVNLMSLAVVIAVALALIMLVVAQRGPEPVSAASVNRTDRAASSAPIRAGGESSAPAPSERAAATPFRNDTRDDLRPR